LTKSATRTKAHRRRPSSPAGARAAPSLAPLLIVRADSLTLAVVATIGVIGKDTSVEARCSFRLVRSTYAFGYRSFRRRVPTVSSAPTRRGSVKQRSVFLSVCSATWREVLINLLAVLASGVTCRSSEPVLASADAVLFSASAAERWTRRLWVVGRMRGADHPTRGDHFAGHAGRGSDSDMTVELHAAWWLHLVLVVPGLESSSCFNAPPHRRQ